MLPVFIKETGIRVDVVAVGTGAALEIGKRGDADVVFVHAKEDELKLVKEGYFIQRHDVMYNDFVMVGPPDDPAALSAVTDVVEAFRNISDGGHFFVSRGDHSGTHKKEMSLWKRAGIEPQGKAWYIEVGQGMAKTQRIANEKRAYTLTDRGTWLATREKDVLEMTIVFEGDRLLNNQYGIMAVNPERHTHVKYREARMFIKWLISDNGQRVIGSFRDKNGNQLFIPNAGK